MEMLKIFYKTNFSHYLLAVQQWIRHFQEKEEINPVVCGEISTHLLNPSEEENNMKNTMIVLYLLAFSFHIQIRTLV